MKTTLIWVTTMFCLAGFVKCVGAQEDLDYKEGEILVHSTDSAIRELNAQTGAKIIQLYNNVPNIYVLELPENLSVEKAIEIYEASPQVLYAEPNYFYQALPISPDDGKSADNVDTMPGDEARTEAENGGVVYFLVAQAGDHPEGESYVLPVSTDEPDKIEHARSLIELGWGNVEQPLIAAGISEGSAGINRDYLAEGKPKWSWQVVSFEFSDFTLIGVDGSPSIVERHLERYLETGIGFWGHTVFEEIEVPVVNIDLEMQGNQLEMRWVDLGDNYTYTVERTASLAAPDWNPVDGGAWPSGEAHWLVDHNAPGESAFYRVNVKRLD